MKLFQKQTCIWLKKTKLHVSCSKQPTMMINDEHLIHALHVSSIAPGLCNVSWQFGMFVSMLTYKIFVVLRHSSFTCDLFVVTCNYSCFVIWFWQFANFSNIVFMLDSLMLFLIVMSSKDNNSSCDDSLCVNGLDWFKLICNKT